ncbi:hypothetical protein E0L36_02060 [Streptomyces sp. AJS327]|uniref:hypothetical protein n=1 Tax=Streptomyces sp. AJS327 TaxID=2545265 RepID=UPI0015DD7B1D|nr:hypothetical protein [Streptomyces sp. AJS327]MBA0049729.1 hypothetical protein [Streptomyces sp. AJS327]
MSSTCDPAHAPVGDVGAALMMIDSRLKGVHAGKTRIDPEQRAMIDQFTASLDSRGAHDVLEGACTLIYMYMQWLRSAYEDHDRDVLEYVVPSTVATMRMMPRSVSPEAIPSMAGLIVAAGTGLSPSLWRQQYGYWTKEEMTPLEVTAFLLAEHINRLTEDPDFATRLITDALTRADEDAAADTD